MIFDEQTGEIFEGGVFQEVQTGYSSKYTKPFVLEGVNCKEVFDERVSDTVGRRRFRLWVSPMLPDLVVDKELSIAGLAIFCYLAINIPYSTYVYTSIKEIVEGSGYVRQTVYKALDELVEKGYLRLHSNKLLNKEDRLLILNPLYFYIGYYPNRENALKDWMRVVGS